MRNKRLVIGMILMILICAIGYYFLMLKPEEAEEEIPMISQQEMEDITSISINGSEVDDFTILNENGTYSLEKESGIEVSEPAVKAIWQEMVSIETIYKVDSGSESDYGFENPTAIITYSNNQGPKVNLQIGRYASVKDGYYVKRDDQKDIYIIPAGIINDLANAKQNLYIKTFLDFTSDHDYERLTSIEVSGKDEFQTIKFATDEVTAHMELPFTYTCSYYTLKSAFLDYAVHLKADKFVDEEETSAMGFKDPTYVIEYIYDDAPVRVLVGNEANGLYYIKKEGSEHIFLISEEQLAFIQNDYKTYLGNDVYSRLMSEVDTLTVTYQGKSYTLDINPAPDPNDKYNCIFNGQEYGFRSFAGLYNALIGPSRNSVIQEEMPEIDTNERWELEVTLVNGAKDQVSYVKVSDREYEAIVNGECHFTMLATELDTAKERLIKFVGE